MTNVTTSSVQAVQDNFKAERISKVDGKVGTPVNISNTISNGGVTLVPEKTRNTVGTLVFKNQIDTSKAFTFNASFTSQTAGGGGGIGFILQPVDPQAAGVGEGSDPSVDIGIYGQPNTTFIGRDGYKDVADTPSRADTDWTNLTIRQTDDQGHLTATSPTWSNSSTPATPSNVNIPLTEYATLTWTPTSGVVDHKVTGTLTYTTYKDAVRTQKVQTLTTSSATYIPTSKLNSITLNQSVSIAAFGATGNELDERSVQVASTTDASEGGFTAKVNTMPIKITYVDQDGSTPLHDADTTNVNVGDSLTIASTTDLSTNTFAPRTIDGYRFVKAVASDGTNTITVSNSVLNALTSNPNVNNIVVYYTNKVSYTIQPVNALGQNITGLAPTQGTVKIGDSITAPTYTGYTPSTATIAAPLTDGTTLKLAYSAVASSVTVNYQGLPTSLPSNSVNGSIGSTYTIASPTVPGYTADQAAISGTFSKEGNTALTVKYTPSSNSYQVIPVDENQNVIATLPVQTESSTTGDPIVAPTYTGYKLVDSKTLPKTQGGVTSYQLSYQAIPYNVQVTYVGLPMPQPVGNAEGTIGTAYQINSPIVAGYTPDKTTITGTFSDSSANSFTVNYTPDTKVYKVQPVDSNNVPIATLAPQQFDGKTGDTIQYPKYDGYTVQTNNETVPAVSHPTPTINVKYLANASSMTVNYNGLPAASTAAKTTTVKGVTDGSYKITVPTVAGYTPDVSVVTGIYSNTGSGTQTVTYTPNNNSYTITPVDADGHPIAGLSTVSASTKTDAQIEMPDYSTEGYELVASQSIVTQPGVTNYQVKYQADTQKITVNYTGLPATEANLAPAQTQTVKVGDSYNFVSPTITGYTPDIPVVSGVYAMGGESSFKVTYTPLKETVTIAAAGLDPDSAAHYTAITQTGNYGESFSIPVTNVAGYTTKEVTITGTYGADSASNMHVVTYTGQPASVTIVYSIAGNGATAPSSVTLTGIVGGSYTQDSPTVKDYTPDQATVSAMFTAADVVDNHAQISVKYVTSANTYIIQPVDASGHSISALSTTTVGTSDGKTVQVPDFSDQGYITDKTTAEVSKAVNKIITVTYLKQVSYTIQPVDVDNVAISTLSPITTTATVGSKVTPPIEAGYELANPATTYTVPDAGGTLSIQYKVKPVSIALVPVDGNGQVISGLGKWLVSNKPLGGTVINVTPPQYSGYQLKSNDNLNVSVPIQDGQLIVPVTYLKMFPAQLTGSESENYTGAIQTPDSENYKVNLPDGTSYALSASDLQIVSSGSTSTVAKNVGTYNVQLTDAAKQAISDSLSQNYAVTVEDNATFTITPAVLTVPTANTAKVPVNVSDPAQNSQLATSIVVQGATKVYDGDTSTDPITFNVLVPSQYTDFKISTLSDNDFDISSISQNAGNYEVKLSDKGLQDLQAANPNYQFDATDVQSGLFVITKAPVTIKADNVTTAYTGKTYDDATLKAEVIAPLPAKGDKLVYALSANGVADASAVGYPITVNASATDNPNYDITTVSGQLFITPNADAVIKVGNDRKTYDGTTKVADSQYKVGLSAGMIEPTWNASDFDFSGITSANVGNNYSMTLSNQGIADLQKVNPNYAITRANVTVGNFAITPNTTARVAIGNGTKTYDGSTNVAATLFQVTGSTGITVPTLTDDDFDFSGITSANVGSYAVKLSDAGIAALQSVNTNYTITSSNVTGGDLVITPNATGKVLISTGNKVYDGTTNVAPTGFKVTGPADMTIPILTANDFDFSGIKSANVGQYSVKLSEVGVNALQSANANYTITSANVTAGNLNITPAHITITAPSETVTYNGQVPVLPKETVTVQDGAIGTPVAYTISNNVKADAGGYYTNVELPTTGNENYAITKVNGTVTVTPNTSAEITLSDANKIYDGTTNVAATSFKVTGPTDMVIPTLTADDFDFSGIKSANVGQYSVKLSEAGIDALQSANNNYTITSSNVTAGNLNIMRAHITITAPSETVTYNGQVPVLPKETVSIQDGKVGTPVAYTIISDAKASVGDYTTKVNLPTDGNSNYVITTTDGKLSVTPNTTAVVEITARPKVYDGSTNVDVTDFTVTGPVDMTVPTFTAEDFDLSGITSANVGNYSIKLSETGIVALQNANKNYTISSANVTAGTLNVTPAHITITAPSETVVYNGQVPVLPKETITVQDGQIGTSVAYTIKSDVAAGVGGYTTKVNLPSGGNKNYAIAAVNGAVTVTPNASAKVTLSDANKVYDGTTTVAATDFKVTGPADMVIPTLTAEDFDFSGIKSDAGQYSVKLSEAGINALQSANKNYTITGGNVTAGNLNVTPAHITITAPSESVTYNGQTPVLPKETVTVQDGAVGTAVAYTISSNAKSNVGDYVTTVELPTTGNGNYVITTVEGKLSVTPNTTATVQISADPKVYDGTTNVAASNFKVTGPTDMTIPSLNADDFDFSGIDSANVGSYSIKLSDTGVKALQAVNKNYRITGSNVTAGNLNITPDTNAKVQINNGSKAYDGTKAVATTSLALNLPTDMKVPAWNTDDFDFSGVTSANVGDYQISLSDKGINDLQAINKNYTITRQNVTAGNFQITQKDGLTLGVTSRDKTYDGVAAQYTLTLPDGVQTPSDWSVADYSLVAPVNAGTYTVTLSDKGLQDLKAANPNYDIQSAKVTGDTFTISKANVTITAKDESMVYSGEAYDDANLEENVSGKPVNGSDLKYTVTANAATNVNDEGYTIKVLVDSADNLNYNIKTINGKLTITPAPIMVTAPTISKTYDGKAYSGEYQVAIDGLPENGVKPTFVLTDISGDTNAGTYTLTASSQNAGNYAVTYQPGLLTINKADLTVTIQNQTKVYDNNSAEDPQNYALQLSTGDQLTLPSSDFNLMANNGDGFSQNVGTYTISLNQSGVDEVNQQMPNYTLAASKVSTGHFTITPEQVMAGTISVDSITKVYDGDANTDPKTYGLTVSDEYPEFVIPANLAAEDFDTTGITSQNVGNYAVKLTQAGIEKLSQANTNYAITADSISSGQLHITKRPVTIAANDVHKVYDGSSYNKQGTAEVSNTTQSGTPLIYTVSVPKNVDTVIDAPITITADAAANSNYEITTVAGKFTVSAKALADNAITISDATKTYDDDASDVPAFTLSAPDAANNPNFVMPANLTTAYFNTTSAASQNVGNYDVTLTDSGIQKLQDANPNYVIPAKSIGSGLLSITRKAVTISAPALSKIYDGNAYTGADLTGTVTGQVGDQQVVYGLTDLSQYINAGDYEIDVAVDSASSVNQNYDIQTAKGQLTIKKAAVTIAVPQGLTKMYDGSGYVLNDSTATVTGKPDNGATVNYHLSSLENAVNAGTYSVNVTDTADNPNYDITVVPSTFTVTKNTEAPIQIGSASKTYDNNEKTDPQRYAVTLPARVSAPDSWSADDFELSDDSQNVGSYDVALSDKGIQKLNAANTNYSFNAGNVTAGQLTINPASLTVIAPTISQTYDGVAYAGDYSAKISGMPVNATSPSFKLTDISQNVNAGTYGIQASASGDTSNYAITYVDGSLTITPQTLGQATVNSAGSPANTDDPTDNHQADDFVVVQGATKVYDGDTATDPTTYQVLAPSDYSEFNIPTFTADDFTTVSDGQNAGQHVVTLNALGLAKFQAVNKNYQFDAQSIQNGLLVITPAPISIAAPNLTKQYDGYPYTGSMTPVINGVPAKGVAPVYTLTALNDDVNAGHYSITVNFSAKDNSNYTISTTAGQLTITPITPQFRVMIDACYQLYSGKPTDNQVYPVTITGADLIQPEWTPADFVISGTPDTVGTYLVTLSKAGWKKLQQANLNDVVEADPTKVTPGALVIEPVSVAKADLGQIQVGSQTKVYDGAADDPTGYTVTLPDKLIAPVWSAGDFERKDTSENAGDYPVTLSQFGLAALQAANLNYVISVDDITPGQLTITKAPITITAPGGLSKDDDGQPYSGTAAGQVTGRPVNGSSVVYQVNYGNSGSVGTHLVSIIADPKLNSNYEITTVSNNYQILPRPIVVTQSDSPKTESPKFKQAVAEPVFYRSDQRGSSTIGQLITLRIPAAQELDQAKEIIKSAPEGAELVVSSQDGSASTHGQSSNKHSTAKVSKQGAEGGVQETKQSSNYTRSGTAVSGNVSYESRASYQNRVKLERQSANTRVSMAAGVKHLPQTDETQSSWLAVLGVALMSLLGMLGFKKRKSDQ
ncbi:MBG domain-containing protein [Secundilactobacillus yichangensis]|uniref:MBG domain-containing protein n=1 Tax=Secundilactobacillus yichangensis TaxID=2799580 RepID=UPI0019413244|nr:MBG domain-containing protein [Secundilactobacillus yichangensis]